MSYDPDEVLNFLGREAGQRSGPANGPDHAPEAAVLPDVDELFEAAFPEQHARIRAEAAERERVAAERSAEFDRRKAEAARRAAEPSFDDWVADLFGDERKTPEQKRADEQKWADARQAYWERRRDEQVRLNRNRFTKFSKVFTSHGRGTCAVCERPYVKGDSVRFGRERYARDGQIVHTQCSEPIRP